MLLRRFSIGYPMAPIKSLDEVSVIIAMLHDVHKNHGTEFNSSALKKTCKKVIKRVEQEGLCFLTKTLPKLGKALDCALSDGTPLTAKSLRLAPMTDSQLPRFLGELLSRVLSPTGIVLPDPCKVSIELIRQITLVYYKYELPYSAEQEHAVVSKFEGTEKGLIHTTSDLGLLAQGLEVDTDIQRGERDGSIPIIPTRPEIVHRARRLLQSLFARFDPCDITPRHGPGAVATRQRLWEKYQWSNVSDQITAVYPLDEYFYLSSGHVCDHLQEIQSLGSKSYPARVCLVPKDSRGPRLISCEPVDFQWVQQGLGRAIVKHVEAHPLTKGRVNFTNQEINRQLALSGSVDGSYSTLDLSEASDRVSLELVRLLFPERLLPYLEACRTSATELPDGRILNLLKFAPMGSALCFPVLALTTWAILAAGAPDRATSNDVYVYGDDVIVPRDFSQNAIEHLESFGLKVNRDKSCFKGFFRESCGMDAYKGVDVTPVRIRTVWTSSQSPESYVSWIAYANAFWLKGYKSVYEKIVQGLESVYGPIPSYDMVEKSCPSLLYAPEAELKHKSRTCTRFQKKQYYVRTLITPKKLMEMPGWTMLLRHCVEGRPTPQGVDPRVFERVPFDYEEAILRWCNPDDTVLERRDSSSDWFDDNHESFSVRSYTQRRASKLVRRWR